MSKIVPPQFACVLPHAAVDPFRLLVESVVDYAIFMLDPAGNVVSWNLGAERIKGYKAEEILGRHFSLFYPAEDVAADKPRQLLHRALTEGRCEVEVQRVRKDGTTFWALVTVTALFDSLHQHLGFAKVTRDLTERHRQELTQVANESLTLNLRARDQARQQVEQKLRSEKLFSDTMIESMPGILYFYDAQGRFLRWNRNFETISGYSGEEIARMHPLDFFADPVKPLIQNRIDEVFEKGESSVEAEFMARDGSTTPYFFTGRRVEFDGKPCLVGVGIDISERRRAEEARRESEARYHKLFDCAPDGIVLADPTSRYLDANASICRMLGYTRDELIGLHATDILVPTEFQHIKPTLKAIKERSDHHREWRFRRKDGSEFDAEVIATRLPDGNLLAMIRDISERKLAEAEREKRHRAEAADRIKSAFLATMSHELRTPLNSIIGFTGILLQGLAGPLNAEQSKQLDMVRSSARHLLALVNDVLDISKIEAGQLEVARAPFDLHRSIHKVLTLVKPQADAKRLELHVRLAPDLGVAVSDERRFEQILLNLLSNAIKFTEHGAIALTADLVPEGELPGDSATRSAVRLRVSDTGIGIRSEDLLTLFQPFRQIDSGLSRRHEGTGLGLAICRRLADLMGGEIHAESEWGKGSCFSVTLPLHGPVKS